MADNTPVNSQITDAVTQANVHVLAEAPAMAMGSLYQNMAASLSVSVQNGTTNQQNANTLAQAVTAKCTELLIGAK